MKLTRPITLDIFSKQINNTNADVGFWFFTRVSSVGGQTLQCNVSAVTVNFKFIYKVLLNLTSEKTISTKSARV